MLSLVSMVSCTSEGYIGTNLSYSEELSLTFDLLDSDKDGYISPADVTSCLQKLNIPSIPRKDIMNFLSAISTNAKGVAEEEFISWISEHENSTCDSMTSRQGHRSSRSELELKSAFDIIDKDRRGYITKNDVKRLMDSVNQPIAGQTLEQMFNLATGQKHKQRLTCKGST